MRRCQRGRSRASRHMHDRIQICATSEKKKHFYRPVLVVPPAINHNTNDKFMKHIAKQ